MRYSNTTIRELNAQYRSVLKKCALFNAAVLIGALVAMPAVAATEITDRVVVSASDEATYDDILAKDLDSLDKNGAAIQIEGKATITNSTFENNSTGKNGGAIRVQGPTGASAKDVTEMPSLSISNTKFIANTADGVDGDSGALSIQSGTVNITNSTFDQNTAGMGGAIYAYTGNYSAGKNSEHNFVKVTIKDSVFTNNIGSTTNAGDEAAGAIANVASASRNGGDAGMWIDNTRFEGNQAIRTNAGGGAIFAGSESRTNIANSSFTNNSSETVGGAIATRVAVNATGSKNSNTGVLDIINTTFTGNKATTNGGAIDNYLHDSDTLSGSVYVANSAFDTNSAENGGAIYNHGDLDKNGLGGNMTIKDSTFTGNTAATAGGAIYNNGTMTIDNGTFTNNSAGDGGAISLRGQKDYASDADLAVLNLSNSKFSGNSIGENGLGGAIWVGRNAKAIISNTVFDNNVAEKGWSGALYANASDSTSKGGIVEIYDTQFTNNKALGGGAAGFYSQTKLQNVLFDSNSAIGDPANTDGEGGAFTLGSVSKSIMDNITVTNNSANLSGGAIAMREASGTAGTGPDNSGATLTIQKSTFANNRAGVNGGAIWNTFYTDFEGNDGIKIADTTFKGNSAGAKGGAIYNDGKLDKKGNNGAITFSGTVNFEGNTAGNVKNDIYNDGIINIAAGATVNFDGGIDADTTTAGSVLNIGDGATLGLRLTSAADYTQIKSYEINYLGTTNLNLTIGAVGTYNVFDSEMDTYAGDILPTIMANPLYDFEAIKDVDEDSGLEYFTGSIKVSTKSVDKIVEDTGLDSNQANALAALTQSDTELSNQLALAAQEALQAGNTEVVKQEVDKLNPETAPVTQTIAQNNHTQVLNVLNNRMTGFGRNGGDVKVDYGAWAQTMYNKSKLDGEFKGYTQGLAAGFDALLDDTYTVGLGYAYSASTVKPTGRKMDVWAHNFFLYGQYKPNKFYVNGALNYARSEYKEKTNVLGIAFNSKFDTDTYSAQAVAGYELPYGFTPEAGARYVYVHQEKYNNGLADIKAKNNDVLTGVAGVKYAAPAVGKEFAFQPEVKAFATYDFLSDNGKSVVTVAGASPYMVTGKRLARFGAEFGVGATLEYKDAELTLSYDLGVRRDYTSQTGTLKLKYNF